MRPKATPITFLSIDLEKKISLQQLATSRRFDTELAYREICESTVPGGTVEVRYHLGQDRTS